MAQHNAAPAPAGQSSASPAQQMAAEPRPDQRADQRVDHRPPRPEARKAARVIGAFGSGGGAAWVFSDLASI